MAQLAENGRIVLTFVLGTNNSKGTPQWQARDGGVLYVPHYDGATPNKDDEQWVCRCVDQIGGGGRKGRGVVVVWLITRYVSQTQQRKAHREDRRRQFANA